MNTLQHGNTTILSDDAIGDWVTHLITQCIDFYSRAKNTKVVLIKDAFGAKDNVGLAIADIEGFLIYWKSILSTGELFKKDGVAPIATTVHCIVDTVFHEMHHVESYHEDRIWVLKHHDEEEDNANKVAKDLCVEFFRSTKLEVPLEDTPYIFKSGMDVITDLREYFNLLLDSGNTWGALVVESTTENPFYTPAAINPIAGVIDPLGATIQTPPPPTPPPAPAPAPAVTVTAEDFGTKAMALYNACFDHIFGGCIPTATGFAAPEKIVEPIITGGIVASAKMMNLSGVTQETPASDQIAGLVFKTSKLPAYEFTLTDGKRRKIIPQNPQKKNNTGEFTSMAIRAQAGEKIGYIIDAESNKFLLRYENGAFTPC